MKWKNALVCVAMLCIISSKAADKRDQLKIKIPDTVTLTTQLTDNCFTDITTKTNLVDSLAGKQLTIADITRAVKKSLLEYLEATDCDDEHAAIRLVEILGEKERTNLLRVVFQEYSDFASAYARSIVIIYAARN